MWCTVVHVPDFCSVPWSQHPTKDAGGMRLYLFCSTVTSSRSLSLSTSVAWNRALCSVISACSTSQPWPANLRKAQAQRVCLPLPKWKKWNKGRVWATSQTHLSEGEGRMQSRAHYLPPAPISRLQGTEQKYLGTKSQGRSGESCFQGASPPHHPWKQTSTSDQFIISDSPPTATAKVKEDCVSQVLH